MSSEEETPFLHNTHQDGNKQQLLALSQNQKSRHLKLSLTLNAFLMAICLLLSAAVVILLEAAARPAPSSVAEKQHFDIPDPYCEDSLKNLLD